MQIICYLYTQDNYVCVINVGKVVKCVWLD